MNDSSTGGVLLPTSSAPLNDAPLDLFFQTYFATITGLAPQFVRPRFSAEPDAPPDFGATWAAVGVMEIEDDQFPQQDMQEDGSYALTRHETLGVMCSFYGARAQEAARRARDTILIEQNREALGDMVLVSADRPIKAPALVQTRWTNRIDVTFRFRRAIVETYAILSIESAVGTIATDAGQTATFDTSRP